VIVKYVGFYKIKVYSIFAFYNDKNNKFVLLILQMMIKYLPLLKTINISCCSNITDDAFLVYNDIQTQREACPIVTLHLCILLIFIEWDKTS